MYAQAGSPAGAAPVDRLEARRTALAHRLGTGVAILPSSAEGSIEGDYPPDSDYREDKDLFYLTGAEAPESWLVVVAQDSALKQAILYLPQRDTISPYRSVRWVGRRLNPGPEATALTGIGDVRPAAQAQRGIPALVFGPDSPARHGMGYLKPGPLQADSPFLHDSILGIAPAGAGLSVGNLAAAVAPLRLVKDGDELARLRKAIALTADAEQAAMRALRPGMYEYEIEALIEYTFRRGGDRASRVSQLHRLGAELGAAALRQEPPAHRGRRRGGHGYQCGIRIHECRRDHGAGQRDVHASTTGHLPAGAGHSAGRDRLGAPRDGHSAAQPDRAAYLRAHSDTLCGTATCDKYFVHRLSHWLRMDVHDVGNTRTPLAPGMVLTVEPGIYLLREGPGVRIEDEAAGGDRKPDAAGAAAGNSGGGLRASAF